MLCAIYLYKLKFIIQYNFNNLFSLYTQNYEIIPNELLFASILSLNMLVD